MGMKVPAGHCPGCLAKLPTKTKWCERCRPVTKYHSTATVASDGRRMPSKKEVRRYEQLLLMERNGLISGLRCQVPFVLVVNGEKVGTYVADFVYLEGGIQVVEDAKGHRTPYYKLKARLFRAVYGYPIREV